MDDILQTRIVHSGINWLVLTFREEAVATYRTLVAVTCFFDISSFRTESEIFRHEI
jgi:hypothetical protein